MKKELRYCSLILIVIAFVTMGILCASGDELPAQDPITLKQQANIEIKEIPANDIVSNSIRGSSTKLNFISKQEAIDTANNFTGHYFNSAKIKAQINLLTDNVFTKEALDQGAINADPILKSSDRISDIPVWLVSYQGIKIQRHETTFTEQVVIVDAISGKVLYSLRYR